MKLDINKVVLTYGPDVAGQYHEQPLADIVDSGTLIDPIDGDDLSLHSARS